MSDQSDKAAAEKATFADFEDFCRRTPEGRLVLAKLSASLVCYEIDVRDDSTAERERRGRAEGDTAASRP